MIRLERRNLVNDAHAKSELDMLRAEWRHSAKALE